MPLSWRNIADWAKHRPAVLRLADRLGRGRGRLRLLDRLGRRPLPVRTRPSLSNWEDRKFSAIWIGHATVLLRLGGLTILTDPVFSDRIGLGVGVATLGPRRRIAPAVPLARLPPVDLILVSHAHFDHLDRPTLVKLKRQIPVITSEHNGDLIRDLGFRRVRELRLPADESRRTGESIIFRGVTISARRVPHWAPRTFLDVHRGYAAFLIEAGPRRVLFGGDSAGGGHFDDLRNVDLAILGIGGYDPYRAAHATPEEVWQMALGMGAQNLMPVHHSTFRLSLEPPDEPLRRLLRASAADAAPAATRIVARAPGDAFHADADECRTSNGGA